jgi:hypothetical protein
MMLCPDVLFSDGAIAPFGDGHHTGTVGELPDDARPLSGPEPDRVRRDLGWCTATAAVLFDVRLHGRDVLLYAVGRGLSLPFHEDIVGVMVSKDTGPIGIVPSNEIKVIHTLKVAINSVVVRHFSKTPNAIE